MQITELDTPVATVDLDAVERNIARMQGYCDEHGLALRPHVKTHKLPAIAHMQLDAGAVGITCQKLGEAEVMEDAGFDDILLTFPLIGTGKAERLAALAGRGARHRRRRLGRRRRAGSRRRSPRAAPRSASSSSATRASTAPACRSPTEAADLAELVDCAARACASHGLMTYPTLPGTGPWLRAAIDAIEARGLEVETVSARRHADVLHEPRGARGHRGARRHVRLRRPLVHRRRLGAARGLRAARPHDRRQPADGRPRHPRRRLEDADERPGRGGGGRRPRPRRRVPRRADLRAVGGARPRRPLGVRGPARGRRGRHRRSRTTRAAARTCTTRSSSTAAAACVGVWPVAARGKLR